MYSLLLRQKLKESKNLRKSTKKMRVKKEWKEEFIKETDYIVFVKTKR